MLQNQEGPEDSKIVVKIIIFPFLYLIATIFISLYFYQNETFKNTILWNFKSMNFIRLNFYSLPKLAGRITLQEVTI